jgi:hypothetical protein
LTLKWPHLPPGCLSYWSKEKMQNAPICLMTLPESSNCTATGSFSKIFRRIPFSARSLGGIVVKALCCKPEGRGFETRWGEWIYRILTAALGPEIYSAEK